jgi:hypothetical protein
VGVGGRVVGWGVRTPDAEHTTPPDSSLSTVFFLFRFILNEKKIFRLGFPSPRPGVVVVVDLHDKMTS